MIVLPQWQFVRDPTQRWGWIRVGTDRVRMQSERSFGSRLECIRDAVHRAELGAWHIVDAEADVWERV
jgi:hypothetical protein